MKGGQVDKLDNEDIYWQVDSDEICGQLYLNEAGEYATCILHVHAPQTGHCDGVDQCSEFYEDDAMEDVFKATGLIDGHGLPTFEFFEHFEAA
jgi:hypothetical protein